MPKMPSWYNKWFTHYMRLTCVLCQYRFPFCWTKATRVTQTLGSRKKKIDFLIVSCLSFLLFSPSVVLRFLSAFYPRACVLLSVCSLHFTPGPQCAFYTDRFNDHLDDHILLTYDMTPGLKPFTLLKTKKK